VRGRHLAFRRFWTTEAGLTGVLVFLLLYFIASFSLDRFHFAKFLSLIFLSLFFISAAVSVSDRPISKLVFGGLALVALGFIWTDFFFPTLGLRTWRALADILVVGYLIILLLSHVFREGTITYHRICGALAVYLLLSWMWGSIYLLILRYNPGAITLPPEVLSGPFEGLEAAVLYFSVVTLTTLGYGDIVPVSHSARLAVMLEALFGQLYPAIMLAWLVSMEIVDRTQKR
jgi:voltage-gated potassium channel Kch